MLPIAGQTAGLIGEKIFVETHGLFPHPTPWAKNIFKIFFPRRGPSAIYTQEGNRKNANF